MNQDSMHGSPDTGCALAATTRRRESSWTVPSVKNAEQSSTSAPRNASTQAQTGRKDAREKAEEKEARKHLESQKQYREGYRRSRRERWSFPVKVRVRHPLIGEVIVPGASRYAAILCACERYHRKFTELHDAEVRAV